MFDFMPEKVTIPQEEADAIRDKVTDLLGTRLNTRAVPKVLYHYTDAAGLQGIIEGGVMRATHLAFMNDASEYVHAVSLLLENVRLEMTRTAGQLQLDVLNEIEKSIAETRLEDAGPYFVACFSAQENSLNQWRAYGRGEGGFSIGFDTTTLIAQMHRQDYFVCPTIYDREEQATLVRDFLAWVLNEYPRVASKHAGTDRDEHLAAWTRVLLWTATLVAPVMKNPAFAEEEEWRLIHIAPSRASVRFLPRLTGLAAFVELKLGTPQQGSRDHIAPLGRTLPDRLPIKVLWSGPGRATDASLLAGRVLLEQHGYDGVRLMASKIPYRVG